jgi:hypothetical protein
MANIRVLKTPFNDEQTGKPQVWQFDLDDPKQAAEYGSFRNQWAMEKRRAALEAVGPKRLAEADRMTAQYKSQMPTAKDATMMGAMLAGGALGGAAGGPLGAVFGSKALPALGSLIGTGFGAGTVEHMGGGTPEQVRGAASTGMVADLGGQALARMARGTGMASMRSGVNPPEWISRDHPATWRTAMREGISPADPRTRIEGPEKAGALEAALGNPTPFTGAKAAEELLKPANEVVERVLARRPNDRVDMSSVFRRVRYNLMKPGGKFGRLPTRSAERQAMEEELTRIAAENPGQFDLMRTHQLKRGAQNVASDLFRQKADVKKTGAMVDRNAEVREIVNEELAAELLRRLNKVPGYRAAEDRVRDLMGVEKAFRWREASVPENLNPRLGNTGFRIDPFALLPEHARGILGRALDRGVAPAVRPLPAAAAPWLRPDAEELP